MSRAAFLLVAFLLIGCGRSKDEPLPKVAEPTPQEPALKIEPKPKPEPPKPKPSIPVRRRDGDAIAGWGTVNDPDGDCTILEKDGLVSITIPGTLHDINPRKDGRNSPRVLREIEGDFRAVVRVTADFAPVAPSTGRQSVPFNGAGLVLFADDTNLHLVIRNHFIVNGNRDVCFAPLFELFESGQSKLPNPPLVPADIFKGETTALYLERKGNVLRGSYSHDSKNWETPMREVTTTLPSKLRIGVVAISTSSQPFKVTFDGFKILDE